jgi:CheY-like chemotaxis protein
MEKKISKSGDDIDSLKLEIESLKKQILENNKIGKGLHENEYQSLYHTIPITKSVDLEKKKYIAPAIKSNYLWADKKVLIVDDVYEVYKLISVYLRDTKIKQLYAKNGLEAIELCTQNSDIDIVLLDIQLPDIDGYQVVKKLKNLRKNLPVVAQTAFALSNDKEKTLSAGFDDYTTKPISKHILLELMDKFL